MYRLASKRFWLKTNFRSSSSRRGVPEDFLAMENHRKTLERLLFAEALQVFNVKIISWKILISYSSSKYVYSQVHSISYYINETLRKVSKNSKLSENFFGHWRLSHGLNLYRTFVRSFMYKISLEGILWDILFIFAN